MPDTMSHREAASPRAAVLAALALARGDTTQAATPGVLPSARSRLAVERLVEASTIDGLTETHPDMRALLSDLLDWNGVTATKATVRAAGAVLTSRGPDGRSRYAQAVEMLSFAATVAPLLEPDRVARVIAAAASTSNAYGPIRYPATTAAALRRVVGHYQQARLESLLISLWETAHDGRWWDACGGLGRPERRRRRRRRNADGTLPERGEELEAESRAIAQAYRGQDADLLAELLEERLVFTPPTLRRLESVSVRPEHYAAFATYATGSHDDPDQGVLVSYLGDLAPGDRPPSPIPVLVESLEFLLGEEPPATVLPKKPAHWAGLYPDASLESYPIPENVLALDWTTLPGTGEASAHEPAVIEWCRTPHALFQNRDHMGNCTGGYDRLCRAGTCFIGKVHFGGEIYNFSIDRRPPGWFVSQVQSRYNRGGVPQVVTRGLNVAIAGLGG